MRNLTKAIFFSLFFLFSLNLYSLEIYQADCKNVEKGVQDIWKFEIDDESSYEAIKLQTQEFEIYCS